MAEEPPIDVIDSHLLKIRRTSETPALKLTTRIEVMFFIGDGNEDDQLL
jgi:hypothetical protein